MVKYSDIFVIDNDKLPKTGASKLSKFLTSNWSKGLIIFLKKFITKFV